MTAPPSVSIGDLERAYYLAGVPAADNNLAVTMGQGVVTSSPQNAAKYASAANSGTLTTPSAASTICFLTLANAGYYKVVITAGFGATAESTAIDNFQFNYDGGAVSKIPVANVANTQSIPLEFYVNSAAGKTIAVLNVSGGSAGSVYKATIIATRVA